MGTEENTVRQSSGKTGIIEFLKSPVFALASAGLAWWTWDKQWAGAIPAIAFMAAFYAVLWMVYNLAMRSIARFPDKFRRERRKNS